MFSIGDVVENQTWRIRVTGKTKHDLVCQVLDKTGLVPPKEDYIGAHTWLTALIKMDFAHIKAQHESIDVVLY